MDFKTLPPGPLRLDNVTVPACLIGQPGDLIRTSLGSGTPVDMAGAMALVHAGVIAYLGLAVAGAHALWQLRAFDANDGAKCLKLFKSNRDFGLIIAAGLLLDYLL